MEELELRFDDEAGIYLPQVVAEENKRKANEFERTANEEERKANEKERVANEEYRIKTMQEIESQADSIIDEINANLKKIGFIKRYKTLYTTTAENEIEFSLPKEYTDTSMLDVRVNGWTLNETEYTIDSKNLLVTLTNPVNVGTIIELVVTRLTTAHVEDYDSLLYDDTEIREIVETNTVQVEANTAITVTHSEKIEEIETQTVTHSEKIESIETQVGNVSNVLDLINGESVVE